MIPHTPLLLVTAAQTLARHAPRLARERPQLPCSLEFVLAVGAIAHADPQAWRSSWPLTHVTSIAMLLDVARRRDQRGERARCGDLLVFSEPAPGVAGEAAGAPVAPPSPGAGRVGIVLDVIDPCLETTGAIRRCLVATARETDDGSAMEVELLLHWCDTRWRDTVIRWYATADDLERAA